MTALAAPNSTTSTSLARNRLGVFAITVMLMAAAAPMTVIAGGATGGFAIAGQRGVPIAYVAVAIILGVFALPYVAMARELPNAGAFYVYVTAGLGRVAGAMTAFVAVLSYNAMQVGLYGGLGYEASNLLRTYGHWDVDWWKCALVGWLLVAAFGLLRVDFSAKLLAILLIGEMVIVLVFATVQVAHPYQGRVSYETLSPVWLTVASAGVAVTVGIAGFVGFENSTVFAEEARDPRRTVPLATFIALTVIGLLYGFCAWAMTVATGPDNIVEQASAESTNLIFKLSAGYLPALIIEIGHVLFLTSLFAAAQSFHNTSDRYFFAMGRDGLLPAVFGRTSQRTKAPVAASLLQSLIGFVVIFGYALFGLDPYVQLFFWITASAGLGVLTLMVATSIAMFVFFQRQRSRQRRDRVVAVPASVARTGTGGGPTRISAWRGLLCPIAATGLLGVIVWQTVKNFHLLLGVDPHNNLRWYFPAAILLFAVLGAVVALLLKTMRPAVYQRIGNGVALSR